MSADLPSLFAFAAPAEALRRREHDRLRAAVIPTLPALRTLSPEELDHEVAGMLERLGYRIELTNPTGQLVVLKEGRKLVVACARPPEPVPWQAIARLHDSMLDFNAAAGFYVTARDFEPDAVRYAASLPITLVDGDKLLASMRQSKANAEPPDRYKAMCKICGTTVELRLDSGAAVSCGSGHFVAPTIARASIFREPAARASDGKADPAHHPRKRPHKTPKAHNRTLRMAHARRRAARNRTDRSG